MIVNGGGRRERVADAAQDGGAGSHNAALSYLHPLLCSAD